MNGAEGRIEGEPRSGPLPYIDGLRAVAIVAVVAFHCGVPFASGGFVGVDVFFVVSGYLIAGLLDRELQQTGSINLPRFFARVVLIAVLAILALAHRPIIVQGTGGLAIPQCYPDP